MLQPQVSSFSHFLTGVPLLTPWPNPNCVTKKFPQLPRQLKKCQFKKTADNFIWVDNGGQGVEPLVRNNWWLLTVVDGIEVRLGQVSLVVFKSSLLLAVPFPRI